MKACPKPSKRIRDKEYKKFVKRQLCFICEFTGDWMNPIRFHHEEEESHGGMGLTPCDSRGIPLCDNCHTLGGKARHRIGRRAYKGKDPKEEIRRLNREYEAQTGRKVGE